jgi:hypothetical protein
VRSVLLLRFASGEQTSLSGLVLFLVLLAQKIFENLFKPYFYRVLGEVSGCFGFC